MSGRRAPAWLGLLLVVGACAVPQHKDLDVVTKKAVTLSEASNVISRFNLVRDQVSSSGNIARMREIEDGSLLDIDTAALLARQRGVATSTTRLDDTTMVIAGSFRRYPLWFVAVGEARAEGQQVAGVFVRDSSTQPWRLELAPRLAASTRFPSVKLAADGSAVLLAPTERRGLRLSPQTLASRYTQVLADPEAKYADDFVADAFLASVRQLQGAQPDELVEFTQTWSVEPVRYALRLSGGGALVFATVQRTDNYRVLGDHVLRWRGSEAVFFPRPVRSAATLSYAHQLLLLMPPRGKPLVIGQYGGLVAASGH